jgi:hypothetical protein
VNETPALRPKTSTSRPDEAKASHRYRPINPPPPITQLRMFYLSAKLLVIKMEQKLMMLINRI